MPGSSGILTMAGDTKYALLALKLAFRTAATARTREEEAPEAPAAAPAKKKQLFSQDHAETKQVPIDEDGASGATFTISTGLPLDHEEALVSFLRENKNLFAWEPKDLVGVLRGVIEHHLRVCPNVRPVKQKVRRQSTEKQSFIVQETRKLQDAGVIREVRYPEWLANPDIVPKKGGKERYHQIKMVVQDVEKTTFLTPCGVYCYTCMPFGLRNAGATFQRLMHIGLGRELGRNAEAYIDDIVGIFSTARTLIEYLEETFASLRKVDLRLNPEKCVFGVPFGKLLGFLVSHRGIEANPEKVKAIEEMSRPQTLKEMQKLAGYVTSLGRFISKLGERALPFFKLMKKKGPFEWTLEADAAFQDLKRYLTSPPVIVAVRPLEPLVLYLAATPHSASAALLEFNSTRVIKGAALADFVAEWTDVPSTELGVYRPLLPGSEGEQVSNNIVVYEGLIASLKVAAALGVKGLTVKGDSQLLVNFSNQVYEPKDEHMEAYLAEVRKIEKQFLGLELQHVPRGMNKEADDIAKRASRRLPQKPGVFEERLFKPSAAPPVAGPTPPQEELPQRPSQEPPLVAQPWERVCSSRSSLRRGAGPKNSRHTCFREPSQRRR
ncbi:uncharacterized protein [Aegilops tauschii subsp. strangulata]|uniref:uncharacterized protein n=1 Tax=Aegilops tauschii subsp. strangulata TaxID=200361 RepID=UPI001ABC543A|nr:uncharacterized protein LOC120963324 [Aegilops tauschii subsp. strangulata]